ncbi:MAG TPA: hypothetical protein DEQ43_20895 [Nocardioides bacterium]|uniref:DUF2157 domain-containing protein n=1 Tax=uncultured Nocardioides sp. TaxID=198441 RepID=UPI000EEA0017|nr:DUF2157 domain-containing protein [uncultured Nocardioides sp.]HCB06665.1 hypothetical protein [Nocardioides sp.]
MSGDLTWRATSTTAANDDPVAAWVADGIITPEQGDRIRSRPDAPLPGGQNDRPVAPLVVEALGYLRGAIGTVAIVLIAGEYWSEIGDRARLALLAGAAAASFLVGRLVPGSWGEAGTRLRSVLWLVSIACAAGFLALWGDGSTRLHGAEPALLVTAGAATYATALFLLRPGVLVQIAMMGLWAAASAALLVVLVDGDTWPGVGVWAVGVLWLLLGELGTLGPVRLTRIMGALLAMLGATTSTSDRADAAILFSLATVAIVLVLAVAWNDLALLGLGALGAVQAIMVAVDTWFPSSLAAPVALLVVGAGLVAAAIRIAARRARAADRMPARSGPADPIGR